MSTYCSAQSIQKPFAGCRRFPRSVWRERRGGLRRRRSLDDRCAPDPPCFGAVARPIRSLDPPIPPSQLMCDGHIALSLRGARSHRSASAGTAGCFGWVSIRVASRHHAPLVVEIADSSIGGSIPTAVLVFSYLVHCIRASAAMLRFDHLSTVGCAIDRAFGAAASWG